MPPTVKVVCAPNALKGSCDAARAAAALAAGVRRADPTATAVELPVADGGDGLLAILHRALGGRCRRYRVTGPRGAPVTAGLLWLAPTRTAVIEMALASGLTLLDPAARDPLCTSTIGTGELLRHALDLGARRVVVGLGGSATTDGGAGLALALGLRLLDADGAPVEPVGGQLGRIARIDASGADPRLAGIRCEAICDVDNPLTGPTGAAAVFAPQKGADADAVVRLEAGLAHLARLYARDLGAEVRDLPGGGAAGGLGAGLVACCGARLRPGAALVLELLDFDRQLTGADLVLTAEGRLDAQSVRGKAPLVVAARARRLGVPCIAIVGAIDADPPGTEPGAGRAALHAAGLTACFSLCPGPIRLATAEAQAAPLLAAAAEQAMRAFLAGR